MLNRGRRWCGGRDGGLWLLVRSGRAARTGRIIIKDGQWYSFLYMCGGGGGGLSRLQHFWICGVSKLWPNMFEVLGT